MSPLTPPTDNLYKFVAISGVAVSLFSVGFPLSRIEAVSARADTIKIEAAALQPDIDLALFDERHFEAEQKALASEVQALSKQKGRSYTRLTEALAESKQLERKYLQLQDRFRQNLRRGAVLSANC